MRIALVVDKNGTVVCPPKFFGAGFFVFVYKLSKSNQIDFTS